MAEQNDWMDRVNRLTAQTVHEALGEMIDLARVTLHDSQGALDARVEGLEEHLAALRKALDDALDGARAGIDGTVRSALGELPEMVERARAVAQERLGADLRVAAEEMRAVFAESVERVNQQFALQSDHVLAEVSSLVAAVTERLDALTTEVAELRIMEQQRKDRDELIVRRSNVLAPPPF